MMNKKKNTSSSSNQSLTVGSTIITDGSKAYNLSDSSGGGRDRAVLRSRMGFLFTLASVAATFGYLSYHLLTGSEHELTEQQFHSIADRATCSALENTQTKRLGTVSLASVIGGANPDHEMWPNVHLNSYESIANNLIQTSKGCNMAFAPFVEPSQLSDFEDYIYDYYQNSRQPDVWPNGTAIGERSFEGVWSMTAEGQAYHDTTGSTTWGNTTYLAPLIQHSTGPNKKLLMNFHSNPLLGPMMDDMITCAQEKESLEECVAITHTMPDRTSWVQGAPNGPGALMMQPISPANEPTKLTGVVITALVWAEIMMSTYNEAVSGIDIVLKQGDDDTASYYTYTVVDGTPTFQGDGDLHDRTFDSFAFELDITPLNLFGPTSKHYQMILYPTQELYDVYKTKNPMLATIGAITIIVMTSLLFLLYDVLVQRECQVKQELLEAKRKFVRFVSHEVRTPLNSVCMGLTLMKEEMAAAAAASSSLSNANNKNNTNHKIQESCKSWLTLTEEVTANAHSAVDVLNDFLNYDKIESGKLTLEHSIVPIFDLVEHTVSEFKLPAAKKTISVRIQTPLSTKNGKDLEEGGCNANSERFVVGDKVRLTQVFRNLISNAIKFTPNGGDITVHATWRGPTDKQAKSSKKSSTSTFELSATNNKESITCAQEGTFVLTVTDTGAGMTPEQVKSVFRQGTQFNVNELQAGNGSGLGTYIAKGIVQQHGGVLSASSEGLKKGSTFSVTLPVYQVPQELTPASSSRGATDTSESSDDSIGSLKILVVDDAKMNLKLLMRLLTKHGHECEGAEDGDIAVEKCKVAMEKGSQYDVILMDYQMPRMDGPTASRCIRQMGCDSFIVGVTGNVMPDDVRFFKDAGANAVLPKPIKLADLEALWFEYDIRGETPQEHEDMINASMQYQMSFSALEGTEHPFSSNRQTSGTNTTQPLPAPQRFSLSPSSRKSSIRSTTSTTQPAVQGFSLSPSSTGTSQKSSIRIDAAGQLI